VKRGFSAALCLLVGDSKEKPRRVEPPGSKFSAWIR
jgi:hypothetical protein